MRDSGTTRRDLIKTAGAIAGGASLAGCLEEDTSDKTVLHANNGIVADEDFNGSYSWSQRPGGWSWFKFDESGEDPQYLLIDTYVGENRGSDSFDIEDDTLAVDYFEGEQIIGETTRSLEHKDVEGGTAELTSIGDSFTINYEETEFEVYLEKESGGRGGYIDLRIEENLEP